jgi:CubicO group peptidase (beta-lactamase class C family)
MIFILDVRRLRRPASMLLALIAVGLMAGCGAIRPISVATGVISHTICSETFVSGLDPERIYAETLRPAGMMWLISWGMHYDVDREKREVRTTFAGGFANRAIYRDGVGCMVVHGTEPADTVPPQDVPNKIASAPVLPEIAGPAVVEPANDKLRAALDRAFAERDAPPYRRTRAVVVVHDGHVVAERYAPGYGVDTPLLGRSLTKSVMSALTGILVRERRLSVEQLAPIAAWQKPDDPRRAITIDHLLRMTSGLAWGGETYSGWDSAPRMENLERDMAAFAASLPLDAAPGSRWNYSGGDYLILSRIIRDAVGGHAKDVLRFAHHELFAPLGMRNVTLEFDATGTPVGSYTMLAPARDWARFGLLYLNDGVVGGRRILPQNWVRYSSTPILDTGYGAGFWSNRVDGKAPVWGIPWGIRSAPRDAFFGRGYLGQFIVVIPSERLVIVRLGLTHRPDPDDTIGGLVGDVIAALR